MADVKLSLSWNAHQKDICTGLSILQQKGEFVDMTIAADGHHVKVHQMVMSLVSPYIKELITSAQSSHPIIFLNRVSYQTLQSILEYVYTGEVMVSRERLCEFLEACNALHIKGLESNNLKSTVDGDLLHLMGAKGVYDEESPEKKTFLQTGDKMKIDELNDANEICEEVTYYIDESQEDDVKERSNEPIDQNEPVKKKRANPSATIQYSLSCQGSIQLILNRYIYTMRHSRKNHERMWRCTDYNKSLCRAYAVTKGDIVLERGCAHNHTFHDKQILKRVRNGNLYAAFSAAESVASLSKCSPQPNAKQSDDVS